MKKLFLIDDKNCDKIRELLQGGGIELAPVDIGRTHECIEKTLFEMGVPSNTIGFKCLIYAIELELTEPGALAKVTYAEVARRVKCNTMNVERNIRFALDRTWEKGLCRPYFKYFQRPHERPSNSVFISTVARIVRERLEKESFGD